MSFKFCDLVFMTGLLSRNGNVQRGRAPGACSSTNAMLARGWSRANALVLCEARRRGNTEIAGCPHVRFGSKADMCSAKRHVRFTPNSGHLRCIRRCPLCANSGHSRNDLREIERPPHRGLSENSIKRFDQAVAAFFILRHPSRPSAPRPVAKSGSAAGSGVGLGLISPNRPATPNGPFGPGRKTVRSDY